MPGVIVRKIFFNFQPQYSAGIDPKWRSRVKAAFILNANLWHINQVTGKSVGALVGAGHSFFGDRIRTSGVAGQYINLPLDGYFAVAPFTVLVGSRRVSGVVNWSLLRRDSAAWYGIYCAGNNINTAENSVFDGTVSPAGAMTTNNWVDYTAISFSANNLRASRNGGTVAVDTTAVAPTGGGLSALSLGASVRSTTDNASVCDFTHIAVIDGAIDDAELASLSVNPWQIFRPQTRGIWVPSAGGTAALTGTITTASEGDIVTGGRTLILTLTGDTWLAAGTGPIGSTANTQAIIDGLDSAQAEGTGWDAVVKVGIATTDVVRTSSTVCTITLPAFATYNITANETITATIPAQAVTLGAQIVASPTFQVTATSAGFKSYWALPRTKSIGMGCR
jgi:hypothetical protein